MNIDDCRVELKPLDERGRFVEDIALYARGQRREFARECRDAWAKFAAGAIGDQYKNADDVLPTADALLAEFIQRFAPKDQ